jgi:alkylation response protein AidB-like acyl-CoA dehydrogenase
VRFSFDAQQVEFRSQLRTFLDKECTAADVRSEFEEARREAEPARRRWEQLAAMGVVGLTAREAEGGLGLGMVDLVGLLEEAGRACLPEPLAETTALVVPFLSDLVAEAQPGGDADGGARGEGAAAEGKGSAAETARDWIRRIADGTAVATVIPDVSSPAVWGREADVAVVFEPGRVVLLTAGDLAAADLVPASSIDSTRRLARLSVPAGSGSTMVEGAATERHLSRLRSRGALASAALLLGAADALMGVTRQYALERHQFGRPIGSFQAVKHHLASAYVKLEMSRPLTYRAALSLDDAPDSAARDCSMAKATASNAALDMARASLQIHGAMGYTWEHDIHLWMKRIWFLATSWGDSSAHFAAVLESLAALGVTTVPAGNGDA